MKGKKAAAHSLLLISRDRELRRQLQTCLLDMGLNANVLATARNEHQCFRALGETRPRLVVFDDDASEVDGMAFLRSLHQKAPETQVVYLTAHHTAELERAVRQLGVLYYTEKPPDSLLLSRLLTSALASLFAAGRPPSTRMPSPALERQD
jgi:DNA-binding NtrC family response regulator